ncbi:MULTISPECIES: MCE family protein [unclassified Nocardia]|uniref:MCE family protein n=1 Tax=unclassified Nocardia TaxID=2637762 RepID=UPI0024A83782|nr:MULTISPECIES: MCE family protein [unclassified Nocardia]
MVRRIRSLPGIALAVVVVLVAAAALSWGYGRITSTRITAYFDRTVGIYEGSDVRILGVPVGSVESVQPIGEQVKVTLRVERRFDIPADASAALVTPSVVSDRYIQITPVYRGGPTMESGATIPRERTVTPVEVDQLYESITELSEALGPNGANREGAVNQLVRTGAANLAGNGAAMADSITQLSRAAHTLSDSRGDIVETVKNLQIFVSMLTANDQQVREFNSQLADLSGFLAGERESLGNALNLLSIALGDVAGFVSDNREKIADNADALTALTKNLADHRDDIAAALPVIPVAMSNVIGIHNGEAGTLDMRSNFQDQLQDPFGTICKFMDLGKLMPGNPTFDEVSRQLRPLLDHCATIADSLAAAVKSPMILPFGILSNENLQRDPVPGTVPGTPSNQLPPSEQGDR